MPKQGFRADHHQAAPDRGVLAQGKSTAPTYTDAAISSAELRDVCPRLEIFYCSRFSFSPHYRTCWFNS
jgi:hypothetical protein